MNTCLRCGLCSHRSLSVGGRWTSWVGWRPLSSSVWRWSGRGRPGMWAGSPSSSAGLCMPARSPGTAGRSTEPGARSYSNMCFQTEEGSYTNTVSGHFSWRLSVKSTAGKTQMSKIVFFSLLADTSSSVLWDSGNWTSPCWLTGSQTTLSRSSRGWVTAAPWQFVLINDTSVFRQWPFYYCMRGFSDTHIDQSKIVFIDWELLRADVFLQSRGIGALKETKRQHRTHEDLLIQHSLLTCIMESYQAEMKASFASSTCIQQHKRRNVLKWRTNNQRLRVCSRLWEISLSFIQHN